MKQHMEYVLRLFISENWITQKKKKARSPTTFRYTCSLTQSANHMTVSQYI